MGGESSMRGMGEALCQPFPADSRRASSSSSGEEPWGPAPELIFLLEAADYSEAMLLDR